jgi:ABC-2 type transport system permease protein
MQPTMLILDYTFSVLLMILTPVILAALFRRRFQTPWILFAIGTLTFIASQVVHIPLNNLLANLHILPKGGINDPAIPLVQSCLVLGFTAGLCEETARAVGYFLLKRNRNLEDGIMLGLGHGGVESMIFGGVQTAAAVSFLIPIIGTDLSVLKLTPEQLSALNTQLQALTGSPLVTAAAPFVERLGAMVIHLFLSLMVLQAFRRRNVAYYLAAIAYHMVIDASSVYASTILKNPYQIYLMLGVLMAPGLVWSIWLWRKEVHSAAVYTQRTGAEIGVFLTAVRKEMIQQWRTQRFLVVMAVFVLFGLTSPMLAKFTPDIIKSMAGAEQFASLIQTPTAVDAMNQYIKSITQFGFILAVLLGMNAVAGEKESGTGAMILSKPMPRWAFVLSKFTAQALVYVSAFLVAGLGAYYYTVILFGSFDAVKFIGINLLLLLWLLTFVSAALLGSVIGSSIAAAAGIGLGISVAFMLAGSIPQYGALMPSGLMNWASMLGSNTANVTANGGAVAGGVVLILLCLIWSVALFERQEI